MKALHVIFAIVCGPRLDILENLVTNTICVVVTTSNVSSHKVAEPVSGLAVFSYEVVFVHNQTSLDLDYKLTK